MHYNDTSPTDSMLTFIFYADVDMSERAAANVKKDITLHNFANCFAVH